MAWEYLGIAGLLEIERTAIPGPGSCGGMYTANTMASAIEALGLSLPGSSAQEAVGEEKRSDSQRAGEAVVRLVKDGLKPRDILTPGAFRNAVAAVLAVSGSINCIKHLQAVATEAAVDIDVFRLFNELGERVPVLSAVRPNGDDSIEAFEAAGGARAVLKQLTPLLDTSVVTATGRTLDDNLRSAMVHDPEVIRPLSRPFSSKPPIVILRGSLAPESAVVKLGEHKSLLVYGPSHP